MQYGYAESRLEKGRRRILVVEDELINREILGFMLRDHYDVTFAPTGAEALEIIDTQLASLSLVLLDLNLPDMKGVDILRMAKSDSLTANLPFIVLTAEHEAEVECLNLGATDFISKPYPKQEVVLARIQRTIELYEDRDIIRQTEHDQLTGLYNREYFYHYASHFDNHHASLPTDAVLVNINHFHVVNERYGKAFGDEMLGLIGKKLHDAIQDDNRIACRSTADTFLIYGVHQDSYDELLRQIGEELNNKYHIRIRMGVYENVDRSIEMERRFDRAKQAADSVKNSFTGAIGVFDRSMHEKEILNEQLIDEFHDAIRQKQFTVYFQPKFDIRGEKPVLDSAEALVRWKHPDLGIVSPGVFIPLFEENGLIRELDMYVWKEAAAKVSEWKKTLGRSIPVSVNVSRIDFYDPQLPDILEKTAKENSLTQGEFLLEITESAYTDNSEQIVEMVNDLRARGFHIEMDDFGAGYSSLNMIATLPIDTLKLDMQFIRTAFRRQKDTTLLKAVIDLAGSLGLPTIAEGVEDMEQMEALRQLGCDIVQGYCFSKPLPAEEFEDFVRNL